MRNLPTAGGQRAVCRSTMAHSCQVEQREKDWSGEPLTRRGMLPQRLNAFRAELFRYQFTPSKCCKERISSYAVGDLIWVTVLPWLNLETVGI